MTATTLFARQLRYWRRARGMSQLELATRAKSTPRYVSFMENGRSRPGEQMVLRLADALDIPIRERNDLLEAAGFSPVYATRQLSEQSMAPYRETLCYVLRVHEPFPALVVNRWWDVVDANTAAQRFMNLLDPGSPPKNLIEWMFDDDSPTRQRFVDWDEVAFMQLSRLRREALCVPNDERLATLVAFAEQKLEGHEPPPLHDKMDDVVCPTVRLDDGIVSLVGLVSRFGSAREVTLDELRVECMYPRDDATEAYFRQLADTPILRAVPSASVPAS